MDNKYDAYFNEIKKFIIDLGIEKEEIVYGCTREEILQIENKFGTLPLSYKAYLESFGRNFLFHFFDAAQYSFDDYDDINEFVTRTFKDDNFEITRPFIPIGHRRYDYFAFIYLDEPENENPVVWFYVPYPDEGEESLSTSNSNFTELILSAFKSSIDEFPAGFHWVDVNESDPNIVQRRYKRWTQGIIDAIEYIQCYKTDNEFIIRLHDFLLTYFKHQENSIRKIANSPLEINSDGKMDAITDLHQKENNKAGTKIEQADNEDYISGDMSGQKSIWKRLFWWLK